MLILSLFSGTASCPPLFFPRNCQNFAKFRSPFLNSRNLGFTTHIAQTRITYFPRPFRVGKLALQSLRDRRWASEAFPSTSSSAPSSTTKSSVSPAPSAASTVHVELALHTRTNIEGSNTQIQGPNQKNSGILLFLREELHDITPTVISWPFPPQVLLVYCSNKFGAD